MNRSFPFSVITMGLMLLSCHTHGQNVQPDTSFLAKAIAKTYQLYNNATAGEGPLFNGVQYKALNLHTYDEGHPYYLSDDWIDGTISYDGGVYQNIAMQYDLLQDKVIIDHPLSHFKLELISEKVKSFILNDHILVRLTSGNIKPDFYEKLYDGNIKAYAHHKKEKQEHLDAGLIKYIFTQRIQYFIYKDNVYYPVRSKSALFKIFYSRKTMLRKYLKKNRINFRKNTAVAVAKSAQFYEESEQQP